MKMRSILVTAALLCLPVALPGSNALSQQKQQVSLKSSAENNKITQSHNVEVGDVPNHIVRVFEVRRTYPGNAPVINGVKLVESWDRGTLDLTDGNGPNTASYTEYVMENGDRFFARTNGVTESGAGKFTSTSVGPITGGTGRFAAIQGVLHAITNFDIKTGFTENQANIEYSIGK
jgi:hypothetical protein